MCRRRFLMLGSRFWCVAAFPPTGAVCRGSKGRPGTSQRARMFASLWLLVSTASRFSFISISLCRHAALVSPRPTIPASSRLGLLVRKGTLFRRYITTRPFAPITESAWRAPSVRECSLHAAYGNVRTHDRAYTWYCCLRT